MLLQACPGRLVRHLPGAPGSLQGGGQGGEQALDVVGARLPTQGAAQRGAGRPFLKAHRQEHVTGLGDPGVAGRPCRRINPRQVQGHEQCLGVGLLEPQVRRGGHMIGTLRQRGVNARKPPGALQDPTSQRRQPGLLLLPLGYA